ncbi:MAG TPA: class I SAM-dependent methyltransferase [Vicinamibacterales bacterium]|jgi:SAM-dependent methyltransferase
MPPPRRPGRPAAARGEAGATRLGDDGWDAYAAFYDWENARTIKRRDVGFWRGLAAAAEGRILELGTGTGRVAVPLARDGIALTGVDRSPAMLARARRRVSRFGLQRRLALLLGDMRALPFRRGSFNLIMAPYGVLQSLTQERDLRAALASVHRVLRPGGRFVIDLVPDLVEWSEYDRRKTLSGRMAPATTVTLIESVRQDARRGLTIFDQRYTTVRAGRREVRDFSLTFRTVSIPGMRERLERQGFAIDAVLGDYQGAPLDLRADVWIILARRR